MSKKYSLKTVKYVYSYWGKSLISYKLGVSFFGYTRVLRKRAVRELKLKKGDVVIDLACGPGLIFSELQKKVGMRGKIIAVDYVSEMINQCKKQIKRKKYNNVILIQQDAAKLKLKKESIDGIISIIGMSAIPNHKQAIKNCYYSLKKGGRLVIMDGKDFNKNYRFLNILIKLIRWEKSYEKKDLIQDVKKIFSKIKVKEYVLGSTYILIAEK